MIRALKALARDTLAAFVMTLVGVALMAFAVAVLRYLMQ